MFAPRCPHCDARTALHNSDNMFDIAQFNPLICANCAGLTLYIPYFDLAKNMTTYKLRKLSEQERVELVANKTKWTMLQSIQEQVRQHRKRMNAVYN